MVRFLLSRLTLNRCRVVSCSDRPRHPLGDDRSSARATAVIPKDDVARAAAAYREVMRWYLPARLTERYSAIEVLPPLALLAWSIVEIWTTHVVTGSRTLATASLIVAGVALVDRHRAPLAALCAMASAIVVPAALGTTTTSAPAVFLLVVAVFASGRYGSMRSTWASLPLAVAVAMVGSAAGPTDTLSSSWGWSLNMIWIWGLGRWLREADRRVVATREHAVALARAAAAEERLRIARDLHDVLAHSLSMMVVQAEVADELFARDPERARQAVSNVQRTGRDALSETRSVLGLLRDFPGSPGPPGSPTSAGTHHGGVADLPGLVDVFRSAGLPVTLLVEPGLGLTAVADEGVFRLVQESLTNTLRHAGPQNTSISLSRNGAGMTVRVENDGDAGAPPAPSGTGHGLMGMRERIEACGGRLTSGPRPEGGFLVEAMLPGSVVGRDPARRG